MDEEYDYQEDDSYGWAHQLELECEQWLTQTHTRDSVYDSINDDI